MEWNRHHIRLPIMNQKLGTPVSRHTLRSSPSSSSPHIGFTRDATSAPRIFLTVTMGESKLLHGERRSVSTALGLGRGGEDKDKRWDGRWFAAP